VQASHSAEPKEKPGGSRKDPPSTAQAGAAGRPEAGDGVVRSTSLFDTSSQAETPNRIAAEWTREEKLAEIVPNPPKVMTRKVLAHETKAPARV
jgi:hypothetical protein